MDDNKKDNLEITLEDLNELKKKLRSLKENIDKKLRRLSPKWLLKLRMLKITVILHQLTKNQIFLSQNHHLKKYLLFPFWQTGYAFTDLPCPNQG